MKNVLLLNLWTCIRGYDKDNTTKPEVRNRLDEKAKSKICLNLENSCFCHLIPAETIDAWNAVERAYDDKGLGSRLRTLQKLCAVKVEKFTGMEAYVN